MNNLPRSRPFRTSPPTIARRNSTTHLPHSFAAYHFAQTSFSEIRERFNKHADLRLEVWQRDGTASDRVLGEGVLHLPDLLTAEEVKQVGFEEKCGSAVINLSRRSMAAPLHEDLFYKNHVEAHRWPAPEVDHHIANSFLLDRRRAEL